MINGKKTLSIIPARGGSKRLPQKNILELAGKPLIGWTIDAAIASDNVDRVIVSTECPEVASIAMELGAEVPFYRPTSLAQDETTTIEVVLHLLQELAKVGEFYDYVLLLQPTSPLRTTYDIDRACKQLMNSEHAESIISVCLAEHHPLWSNTLPLDKSLSSFLDQKIQNVRSQDLPDYYRLNGAIYLSETKTLIEQKTFYSKESCYAFVMSQDSSIDIDTAEDFNHAQLSMDESTMERAKLFLRLYDEFEKQNNELLDYEQFANHISGLINE